MSGIIRLDLNSLPGLYRFITKSESIYEVAITKNEKRLKRILKENNSNTLRKDYEEIKIIGDFKVGIGEKATFILEPLGEGSSTLRITNIVTGIYKVDNY